MDSCYLDDAHLAPTPSPSPGRPWWWVGRAKLSDEEYIEQLRKSVPKIERWKRWRWLGIVVFLGIICATVWLAFRIDATMDQFDQMAPHFANQHRGTMALLGLFLGFKFGYMLQGSVFALIWCLTYDNRAERMLLQYVDRDMVDHDSGEEELHEV